MASKEKQKPVGYLLERTTRLVKLQFHKVFKDLGVDMTPEQWVVLDAVYEEDNQSQKELAERIYKNPATLSRILDGLSKKAWLERKVSEKDRRVFTIAQTNEGALIHKKVLKKVEELRKQGWEKLSQKDYQDFTRIINQIFDNYS